MRKKTKTIAGIFAAAFLFSAVLFSCSDNGSKSTETTVDSSKVAPTVTSDSITAKAPADSIPKKDTVQTDSTKTNGQTPPPKK